MAIFLISSPAAALPIVGLDFDSIAPGVQSDLQVEVEILLEGDDRVAWQRTQHGTHQGDFMGIPASGHPLVWRDMLVSRFENGLIADEWAISDLAERMFESMPVRG